MATKDPKMHVSPATKSDIPRLMEIQYAAFASEPADAVLNGPNTPANRQRAGERLRRQMRTDPTLHVIKCVQAERIVGFCMWHVYERARAEAEWKKEHEMLACGWIEPVAERERARAYTLPVLDTRRRLVQGGPHALLMYLCIDPEYQRQGAGGLLVGWGTQRADELGIPAILESSPSGYGLYRKCGFEDVAVVKINVDGVEITYPAMLRNPMRKD